MKRRLLLLGLLLVAALGACAEPGPNADRISLGSDVVVGAGDDVHGDVVVIGADAKVDGRVRGDVVVVKGDLTLGASARVDGDLALAGGELRQAAGAQVAGSVVGVSDGGLSADQVVGRIDGAASVASDGTVIQLRADGAGAPSNDSAGTAFIASAGMSLLACALLAVLGLIFMSVWPERSRNLRRTLEASPWASLLMGWLVSMGLGLVTVLAVISVVGMLALPLIGSVMLAIWLVGITGLLEAMGDRLPLPQRYRSRGWDFVAGVALFAVLGLLWSAGGVVAALAALIVAGMGCMAVGASVLSGLGRTPYGA